MSICEIHFTICCLCYYTIIIISINGNYDKYKYYNAERERSWGHLVERSEELLELELAQLLVGGFNRQVLPRLLSHQNRVRFGMYTT